MFIVTSLETLLLAPLLLFPSRLQPHSSSLLFPPYAIDFFAEQCGGVGIPNGFSFDLRAAGLPDAVFEQVEMVHRMRVGVDHQRYTAGDCHEAMDVVQIETRWIAVEF